MGFRAGGELWNGELSNPSEQTPGTTGWGHHPTRRIYTGRFWTGSSRSQRARQTNMLLFHQVHKGSLGITLKQNTLFQRLSVSGFLFHSQPSQPRKRHHQMTLINPIHLLPPGQRDSQPLKISDPQHQLQQRTIHHTTKNSKVWTQILTQQRWKRVTEDF